MRPAVSTRPLRTLAPGALPASSTPGPVPRLGPWRLVARIAAGEHLATYRARPARRTDQSPADYLIRVPSAACRDPLLAAALLQREKTVLRSVDSPFLPALLDSDLRHQPPYLVLANLGLHSLSSTDRPLALRLALWRARQIATALAALHQAEWLHARLTPAALLASQRGHLTLHDLGWARKVGTAECGGDKLLAADLRYAAPEMLCDATMLTPACDIYGLGLLLIEFLIGRPAVDATVGWQAALCHLRGEFADVTNFRPDVPQPLVQLLKRMTAREPLRRPVAAEVQRQLVRLELAKLSDDASRDG